MRHHLPPMAQLQHRLLPVSLLPTPPHFHGNSNWAIVGPFSVMALLVRVGSVVFASFVTSWYGSGIFSSASCGHGPISCCYDFSPLHTTFPRTPFPPCPLLSSFSRMVLIPSSFNTFGGLFLKPHPLAVHSQAIAVSMGGARCFAASSCIALRLSVGTSPIKF